MCRLKYAPRTLLGCCAARSQGNLTIGDSECGIRDRRGKDLLEGGGDVVLLCSRGGPICTLFTYLDECSGVSRETADNFDACCIFVYSLGY